MNFYVLLLLLALVCFVLKAFSISLAQIDTMNLAFGFIVGAWIYERTRVAK